jgi:hypothetical protein
MKRTALLFFFLSGCTPKDQNDKSETDTGACDTCTDSGDSDSGDSDSGDSDSGDSDSGDTDTPFSPTITGDCGVLDTELTDAQHHLFENVIDFSTSGFDPNSLSESGTRILDTDNAGGSSIFSEVYAFEVLLHCETASLLKTETEISYLDSSGKITDLLVDIDGVKIGVSVTRAFAYPPETPYTEEMAQTLLTKKLEAIQESSANVAAEDAWEKQILHVLAYTADHSAQVLSVFDDLPENTKADTILLVTTTEGDDDFMY